ncbi:hypothetical protein [Burkholderia vietnamiensis]|nr:hypothetical protein [Burkholderia vietnamiensis]
MTRLAGSIAAGDPDSNGIGIMPSAPVAPVERDDIVTIVEHRPLHNLM